MSRKKLEYAKVLLPRLDGEIRSFLETNPYELDWKKDDQNRPVLYVRKADVIPDSITNHFGDILHNLRASLDHIEYKQFRTANPTADASHVYFKIPQDKHRLQQLHRLDITDKHRDVLVAGAAFESLNIGAHITETMRKAFGPQFEGATLFIKPADDLFPLTPGKELFVGEVGGQPTQRMGARFHIVVHEPPEVEKEEIGRLLREITTEVEEQHDIADTNS
ncbi:MAG: hypothetical protein PHD04_02565 [Candidatus Pacebacteria bacterium]|nr:hypothetical protein [Candidatus Paceibacterota bacterium]